MFKSVIKWIKKLFKKEFDYDNVILSMPPVKKYKINVKITKIKKGKPKFYSF